MNKESKRQYIRFEYNKAMNGPIECYYNNDNGVIALAGGLEMLFKLNLVKEHLENTNGDSTIIRDYLDVNHPLTKDELLEVRQQYFEKGMALQEHKTMLLHQLEEATTQEEVDAIQW